MEHTPFLVALVVLTAPASAFTNGFPHPVNAGAAPIATGTLRPKTAVLTGATR